MHWLFAKRFWRTTIFLLISLATGISVYAFVAPPTETTKEKTTVIAQDVIETVTVSGKVAAEKTTVLSFPVSGTIKQVTKRVGDQTVEGEIIASLTSGAIVAEYEGLRNRLSYFEQSREKILSGSTDSEKAVVDARVAAAQINYDNTIAEYNQSISNAYRALLSNDLQAYPTYVENDDIPPVISGTYTCESEGQYKLKLFNSNSPSGISYSLTGIEEGTSIANSDTALPLGACGLYIKFSALENYRSREWVIPIPNTRSPHYTNLKNSYDLIKTQAETTRKQAEENLKISSRNKDVVYATASPETIAQADANILEAAAQLKAAESRIADYIIKAPYAGVISGVAMRAGESVTPDRTITLAYLGAYELEAQIPEIDITKISIDNKALIRFDAMPNEVINARVTFISPIATEVGGVAYYKTRIRLDEEPSWIREGLNADIQIVIVEKEQVPALPKRFIEQSGSASYVTTLDGQKIAVDLGITGTNDLVEISGVEVGTVVIAP